MPLLIYSFALFLVLVLGLPYYLLAHGHQRQVPRGAQRAAGVGARSSARRRRQADHLGARSVGRRGAGGQPPGQRAERLRAAVSRAALDHHPDRAEVGQGAYRCRPYLLLPAGFPLDCGPLPAEIGSRTAGAGGDGVLAQPADCVPPRCHSCRGRQWTDLRSLPAALSAAALLVEANPGRASPSCWRRARRTRSG